MLTRPALLFIFNTVLCGAFKLKLNYNVQEEFCGSQIVVKATILPRGYIERQLQGLGAIPVHRPEVPKFYRQYELEITEVFKTNYDPVFAESLKRNTFHYAISKDTTYTTDADGCGFYEEGFSALFYFDDWENIVIKRNCVGWRLIRTYAKKVLREGKYGCECSFEECRNRADGVQGPPSSECGNRNDMHCAMDTRRGCIWRGAKKTCVNDSNEYGLLNRRRGRRH